MASLLPCARSEASAAAAQDGGGGTERSKETVTQQRPLALLETVGDDDPELCHLLKPPPRQGWKIHNLEYKSPKKRRDIRPF